MNRIGPYLLLAELGEGGMGSVYLGLHRGIGGFEKKVAIKCLRPEITGDEEFVRMLVDEARLTVQLTHPNIVQVIDLAEDDGMHYIVMEYVEGVTANVLGGEGKALDIDETVHIGIEAARALVYAHRKQGNDGQSLGIVHRDISGQNLLISSEGLTKVLDFGIAKASSNRNRTQMGVLKGKLAYMSPEQALGKELDGRSDIFSLGIVLWELCTGKRLFDGATEIQMLLQVQRCEVEPPSRVVSGFPRELERIIMRCLTREPDERYADADRLADDLMDFLRSFQGAIHPRLRLAERVRVNLKARPIRSVQEGESGSNRDRTLVEIAGATVHLQALASDKQTSFPKNGIFRKWTAGIAVAGLAAILGLFFLPQRQKVPEASNAAAQRAAEGPSESSEFQISDSAVTKQAFMPLELEKASEAIGELGDGSQIAGTVSVPPAPKAYEHSKSEDQNNSAQANGVISSVAKEQVLERAVHPEPAEVSGSKPTTKAQSPKKQVAHLPADVSGKTKKAIPHQVQASVKAVGVGPLEGSEQGFLSLNATPWARVYIDGKKVADSTPLLRYSLKPGKYQVVVVNPDLPARKTIEIEIGAGSHVRQTLQLP